MSFRRPKSNYTIVSNQIANDENISLACAGMLLYLLSKPPDWECRNHDLERRGKFGWRVRRRLTLEAEKLGYLKFVREHVNGRLNCFYEVQMEPLPENERTNSSESNLPDRDDEEIQAHQTGMPVQPHHFEALHPEVLQSGGGIDIKDSDIKDSQKIEVVVVSTPTTDPRITELIQATGMLPEKAAWLLRETNDPPEDLVKAGLATWLEASAKKKGTVRENPIGWLKGVLSDPGRFGVIKGPNGWWYPSARKVKPINPVQIHAGVENDSLVAERRQLANEARIVWLEMPIAEREQMVDGLPPFLSARALKWKMREPTLDTIPNYLIDTIAEKLQVKPCTTK